MGAIERIGRGKQSRLLLSRRFYAITGNRGSYTRRRGLDRETNKELLLTHLRLAGAEGSPASELQQVLPAVGRSTILALLAKLRAERHVELVGKRRRSRWVIASDPMHNLADPMGA